MEQAAARAQVWTNRTLLALFFVSLVLAFELAKPFLSPLVLASFLVAVCYRPYRWLRSALGGRPHLAAALATLAVTVALVLPAAIFVAMVIQQMSGWVAQVRGWLGPDGVSPMLTGQLPPRLHDWLLRHVPVTQDQLSTTIGRTAAWISSEAPGVLSVSLNLLVELFVMVLALYYLFLDGAALVAWFTQISPLKSGYTRELIHEFYQVANATLVGTGVVAVLQAAAAWLIFALLHIPNALVWAMALAFASFVPAIGVGLVYIPMCVILYANGRHNDAFVLLIYSLLVIGLLMDNVVRPHLVKGRLTLHPLVVFVAIFGGVYVFGLVGLLLGPLVASILVTVLRIYARDLSLRRPAPVA